MYTKLNVTFDLNHTPPVTRTLVHDNPHNRYTWYPHRHKGLYIRISMLHYGCLTSYIPRIISERVSNTRDFFQASLPLPRMSSEYTVTYAAADLTHNLLNLTPTGPLTNLGSKYT